MDYALLHRQLTALSAEIGYDITVLSNAAALLYDTMENINWAGFYLMRDGQLCLGPFCGKPACTVIAPGKGVCGTAAEQQKTIVVGDVHQFAGHIACDSASNSEIVVPLFKNGALYGVLDIDSPITHRFTEEDKSGLETFAAIVEQYI